MQPKRIRRWKDIGTIKASQGLCLTVVFGTQLTYVKASLAHGGEDHSRDRESQSSENLPLTVVEPSQVKDSTTVEIPSAPGEGLEQLGQPLSETLLQESLPPPVLPSDTASTLNLGAIGLGEVLFVLIITGPFLLRTLKYRLHS